MTSIGENAFYGCNNLTSVYNLSVTPQSIGQNTFTKYGTLHVYKGYKSAYASADYWKNFEIVDDIPVIDVESIAFEKDAYTCSIGETGQAVAKVFPENATVKDVVWSTSNASVVFVDPNTGEFIGLKNGYAFITARSTNNGKIYSKVAVIVGDYTPASSVSLNNNNLSMELNSIEILKATVLPNNALVKEVTWSSSDPKIVTVEDGAVTAVGFGDAVITAKTMDGTKLTAICKVTVYANFDITVNCKPEEGTVSGGRVYHSGEGATITATPSEGYEFVCWMNGNEVVSYNSSYIFTPTEDANFTAVFKKCRYLVTFLDFDDSTIKSDSLDYQAKITAPANPVREGYTFTGWEPSVDSNVPSHDVTYKATYKINQYTVKFVDYDNTVIKSETLDYGTEIVPANEPGREGYTFTGWSPSVDRTVPAHDVTYVATYSINRYNVTFTDYDGTVLKTETLTYGENVEAPEDPSREGYTFTGWEPKYEMTVPGHDVTYVAQYKINSYKVTFTDYDSRTIKQYTLEYGSEIPLPADPSREGYTFTGWSPTVDETVPAHNVSYRAQYKINQYELTFVLDGAVFYSTKLDYNAKIVAPEVPEKEGHTFYRWQNLPATMPAYDLTVIGNYEVNYYYVRFIDWDGKILFERELPYGSAMPEIRPSEREGYKFVGWNPEISKTVPAHDVDYIPVYEGIVYTVSYYVGDELVKVFDVRCGDPMPEYSFIPEDARYTFVGWDGEEYETMPPYDVEYYAQIVDYIDMVSAESGEIEIYTLGGILVARNITIKDAQKSLPTGFYIVRSGNKTYKIRL